MEKWSALSHQRLERSRCTCPEEVHSKTIIGAGRECSLDNKPELHSDKFLRQFSRRLSHEQRIEIIASLSAKEVRVVCDAATVEIGEVVQGYLYLEGSPQKQVEWTPYEIQIRKQLSSHNSLDSTSF